MPDLTKTSPNQESGPPPVIAAPARKWRWVWFALSASLVPVFGLLFAFNPAHHAFYPFCSFHRLTGWQCPGCGGLRAMHHLLHGEIVTAFRFNQLAVLAAPVAVGLVVRRLVCGPRRKVISHQAQARWAWLALAVLVVFWIVRNLPLEMFRLPVE